MKTKSKEKPKKEKFIDDGRTIVPMNVDGMPWYDRRRVNGSDKNSPTEENAVDFNSLSPEEKKEYRRETRRIIRGVILRFLPFLLAFIGVFTVLIVCLYVLWK